MSINAEQTIEKTHIPHPDHSGTEEKAKQRHIISNKDPYVPHVYVKKRTAEY